MDRLTRREFLKATGMAVTSLGALSFLPKLTQAGALAAPQIAALRVRESTRQIPVAGFYDVLIAGGTTGAVAAAVAAAKKGVKVFLATPYHYLGEDVCATLRLWLEEGEAINEPLAETLFGSIDLPFAYETDIAASPNHPDTTPPSHLHDGLWRKAMGDSVQYNGDVRITLDLHGPCSLKQVELLAYHSQDFKLGSVTVLGSADKKSWKELTTIANTHPDQGGVDKPALSFSAPLATTARYLQLQVKRAAGATRLLLAEITVKGDALDAPASAKAKWAANPLHVKRTLDQALIDAGVTFLFGCQVTDVLLDREDRPVGLVMANRAGRQAILGKLLIDATDRAWVARMAGAQAAPYPAGPGRFKRVTIGAPPRSGAGIHSARLIESAKIAQIVEYTLEIPMEDGSHRCWAKAEQLARDLTYQSQQQYASDVLFQVPPDPIKSRRAQTGPWPGARGLELEACRPAALANFFILSGCADLPRDQAEKLLRPAALMELGSRIGEAAAKEAKALPLPRAVKFKATGAVKAVVGEVGEALAGVRPNQKLQTITQGTRALPVWGTYDVVVVGGGVSGASAGVGATRHGAKTLVLEPLHGLGGVGTLGMISAYYYGCVWGFTKEIPGAETWKVEEKMEWWRSELRKKGGEIWFGALGCGAFMASGRVAGVVVATPQGRGIVLAKVVIDATGNADIAASAGALCAYTAGEDMAVQGAGLPSRELISAVVNTDFTLVDETDMVDTWQIFVCARRLHGQAFDSGQLIDTRERRRVIGDYTVRLTDAITLRTFPDTIARAHTDYDSHGYTMDPFFELANLPPKMTWTPNIPYRCLLPMGLEGILVVGLGISAHRDITPLLRMQRDIQNLGYTAGVAAAMAVKTNVPLRRIDLKKLQKHLVETRNLDKEVLTARDSHPLPDKTIHDAVRLVPTCLQLAAVFLSHPERSLPPLRQAYAKATKAEERLLYARILGVLGDAAGVTTLVEAVQAMSGLDVGWAYDDKSLGRYAMSKLDSLIIALGRTRDPRALEPILVKLRLLDAKSDFSHHRMFALALEKMRRPEAAGPLAELLKKPAMQGHTIQTIQQAEATVFSLRTVRTQSLREILLARALYRCGDKDKLGERLLSEYTKDLRGHFARHAYGVLHPPISVVKGGAAG